MDDALVVSLVLGLTGVLLLVVLAPWRSLRRDALAEEDVYRVLSGEEADSEEEEAPPTG